MVNPAFARPGDFESWVQQDWLYESGSEKALVHVQGKLSEEIGELVEALHDGSDEDIRQEGGDVLWTATAAAINNGPGLERSFRHSSYRRALPEDITIAAIDHIARRRWVRPDWSRSGGFAAVDLADSRREIHRGVRSGNIDATEAVLRDVAGHLGKAARSMFTLEGLTKCDMSEVVWNEDYCLWVDAAYACEAVSQLYTACSSIARTRLGSGLADMMDANRRKLQGRVTSGGPITRVPNQETAE